MKGPTSTFLLGMALVAACNGDPDRPPATGSSGVTSSSGGAGSSSGTAPVEGGTPADGGSSSGGSSGGSGDSGANVDPNSIATGLRASIDNAATEFADSPKGSRQSNGFVVELSGKDTFGNELRLTLTNTAGPVAPGAYDCTGSQGATYGIIAYVVTGGVATWTALASGECTVTVLSIDNTPGGAVVGTFGGTAKRAASTERLITKGQFRLALE